MNYFDYANGDDDSCYEDDDCNSNVENDDGDLMVRSILIARRKMKHMIVV